MFGSSMLQPLASELSAIDIHLFKKAFCFLYCLISSVTSHCVKSNQFYIFWLVGCFPNNQRVNSLQEPVLMLYIIAT